MTKPTKGHVRPAKTQISLGMKKAWVLSYPLSAQQRLWSDWVDAQADPSLCWAHMPFCWFCHEAAHMTNNLSKARKPMLKPTGLHISDGTSFQWLYIFVNISWKVLISCESWSPSCHFDVTKFIYQIWLYLYIYFTVLLCKCSFGNWSILKMFNLYQSHVTRKPVFGLWTRQDSNQRG